jgi:hypothetical protein
MTSQEFLLSLKALRAQYDVQLWTGTEYNRKLLQLHADHAAALLVEQPGPNAVEVPAPAPALSRGLTYAHTEWASQHDWYVSRGLDSEGYYVRVRNDDPNAGRSLEFRDYNELRAWAGY